MTNPESPALLEYSIAGTNYEVYVPSTAAAADGKQGSAQASDLQHRDTEVFLLQVHVGVPLKQAYVIAYRCTRSNGGRDQQ